MAEGQQGVSSMPLPPMQYVSLYTDENIRRGRAPKPPPPIKDNYNMFGVTFHADDQIVRPLEDQGLRRLYPHNYDHRRELKKLNHSIVINFLDLLDILIKLPDSPKRTEKMDDLTLLFIHIHHLINEFRPHQARETLRVMMEVQKRQRLDTAERFRKHLEHVRERLQTCFQSLPDDVSLDSKLLIKTEPMETSDDMSSSSHVVSLMRGTKRELEDNGEEESIPSLQDQMMCDIIEGL
ncbi:hypothetical protein NP493_132g05021 [Ridgeia piscesae]|uniref:Mediator of RNA polymerase II transcription subunit 7 n=1 Tax=Ridgeia piscesae TaxID=27915 RepID=A0AAD9P5B6_RIDPI|nr:hypothetical protein NP493_132g05021 [Ridgeia piscesae]